MTQWLCYTLNEPNANYWIIRHHQYVQYIILKNPSANAGDLRIADLIPGLERSPVAYWAPNDLGSSSFSILSVCLFILFIGFSRQEYWSGLPFPSPVDQVLSEFFTMNCPSLGGPTQHGLVSLSFMEWLSFIELDKAVDRVIRGTSFLLLWFQCVCPLMPSCNMYRLTWVSLTLDVGYLFTAAPVKHSRCSLPWMRDISSPLP